MYRHRGHRWISVRRFDRAIEDLSHAAALVEGKPDEVEPDGQPNERGIPTSTLQSNIHYHLALAHYLKGDFEAALKSYEDYFAVTTNADQLVAISHWWYMALRRLGRDEEAAVVLEPVTAELDVIENTSYHRLLLMYKGEIEADELWEHRERDPSAWALLTGSPRGTCTTAPRRAGRGDVPAHGRLRWPVRYIGVYVRSRAMGGYAILAHHGPTTKRRPLTSCAMAASVVSPRSARAGSRLFGCGRPHVVGLVPEFRFHRHPHAPQRLLPQLIAATMHEGRRFGVSCWGLPRRGSRWRSFSFGRLEQESQLHRLPDHRPNRAGLELSVASGRWSPADWPGSRRYRVPQHHSCCGSSQHRGLGYLSGAGGILTPCRSCRCSTYARGAVQARPSYIKNAKRSSAPLASGELKMPGSSITSARPEPSVTTARSACARPS